MRLLRPVPDAKRAGPLVIDGNAGRPYARNGHARQWRKVADAAGIPREAWNMDARVGAIIEADDAEAEPDEIRAAETHA